MAWNAWLDLNLYTRLPWLDSHHSFSFSRHYDPANTHHGLLLVSNDDVVRADAVRGRLIWPESPRAPLPPTVRAP